MVLEIEHRRHYEYIFELHIQQSTMASRIQWRLRKNSGKFLLASDCVQIRFTSFIWRGAVLRYYNTTLKRILNNIMHMYNMYGVKKSYTISPSPHVICLCKKKPKILLSICTVTFIFQDTFHSRRAQAIKWSNHNNLVVTVDILSGLRSVKTEGSAPHGVLSNTP